MYGRVGKLTTKAGSGRELAKVLVAGSQGLPGNRAYHVALDGDNEDHVWIYELWDNEQAHQASLQLESVIAAIGRGRPLIERFALTSALKPVAN
ncbi:MAG: putative quinol monooxygenase [Pseudomonadota bacterium]